MTNRWIAIYIIFSPQKETVVKIVVTVAKMQVRDVIISLFLWIIVVAVLAVMHGFVKAVIVNIIYKIVYIAFFACIFPVVYTCN